MSTLTIDEIMKILPHRYPILLVDKVVACDDEKKITGIKNVSVNEPAFQGHFPGAPIMPGVLQLEAMAQTGGILLKRLPNVPQGLPFFMGIDKAKFRKVVRPGDQMRIEVEIIKLRSSMARFKGEIYVDDALVSEAELMCMISDQKADA